MTDIPQYNKDRRVILYTVGLPASGKSYWAKKLVASDPNRWKRINRDDTRWMLHGDAHDYTNKKHEQIVTDVINVSIQEALKSNYDVILDNTHLRECDRTSIHNIAQEWGDCTVVQQTFMCPVETCLERNAGRQGLARVPDEVILKMARSAGVNKFGTILSLNGRYDYSTEYNAVKPVFNDPSLPPVIICDLDGTLCIHNGRSPYEEHRCGEDLPNPAVINILNNCVDDFGGIKSKIVLMSGRTDSCREQTEAWLNNNLSHDVKRNIIGLFMRETGDQRKDYVVKTELFNQHVMGKYFVRFVLDDRSQVVQYTWRRLGLTCLQVAEGDF